MTTAAPKGPAATAPEVAHEHLTVPIALCDPHPRNRKRLGDIEELTADIKANGIHTELIGRRLDGRFQVLAGSRRLAAGLAAGVETLPIDVRELDDHEAFRLVVRENLFHLAPHPLDELEYFLDMRTEVIGVHGEEVQTVAEMIACEVGKTEHYVASRLALEDLDERFLKAWGAGDFSAAAAMEVARLDAEAQEQCWDTFGRHGHDLPSAKRIRDWVGSNVVRPLKGAPFDTTIPLRGGSFMATFGTAGGFEAPACAECPARAGNAPSLFGGMGADTCTRPSCYFEKVDAHLADRARALDAQNETRNWVPINAGWPGHPAPKFQGRQPEKLAESYESTGWEQVPEGAAAERKAIPALVVGGRDAMKPGGLLGRIIWIAKRQKVSRSGGHVDAGADRWKREQALRQRNDRIRKTTRAGILAAVLPKVKPTLDLHRRGAVQYFREMWHENQKPVLDAMGWTADKRRDSYKLVTEKVGKMGLQAVGRFVAVMTMVTMEETDLKRHAAAAGVDVAAIAKAAKVKHTPKPKRKKKVAKKRTRAKPASNGKGTG